MSQDFSILSHLDLPVRMWIEGPATSYQNLSSDPFTVLVTWPSTLEINPSVRFYANETDSITWTDADPKEAHLIPRWRFTDLNGNIIDGLTLTDKVLTAMDGVGPSAYLLSAQFAFIDDLPTLGNPPTKIWTGLDLSDYSFFNSSQYNIANIPGCVNSNITANADVFINALTPTCLKITRDGLNPLYSYYWTDICNPFVAVIRGEDPDGHEGTIFHLPSSNQIGLSGGPLIRLVPQLPVSSVEWTPDNNSSYLSAVDANGDPIGGYLKSCVCYSESVEAATISACATVYLSGPRPFGEYWTQAGPQQPYYDADMSNTGQYRTAVAAQFFIGPYPFGGIFTSSDYGANWSLRKGSPWYWVDVSISGNTGQYQIAARQPAGGGQTIWTSNNYGANWTPAGSPVDSLGQVRDVAVNDDGSLQAVIDESAGLYLSTDYGSTWTLATGLPAGNKRNIAFSADGKYQTTSRYPGIIYVSSDYGSTWTASSSPFQFWISIRVSSTGQYQIASAGPSGGVYFSTDYGNTWQNSGLPGGNWTAVDVSADGQYMVACLRGGGIAPPGNIWVSTDGGSTWTPKESPRFWSTVVMTPDARYMLAATRFTGNGDYLYNSSFYAGDEVCVCESEPFDILEYDKYDIRKFNESWESVDWIKQQIRQDHILLNEFYWDRYMRALWGDDSTPQGEAFGREAYEKVANFTANHADINTCDLKSVYDLARETDVPIDDYSVEFPPELRRIIDLGSVNQQHLWGSRCRCSRNITNKYTTYAEGSAIKVTNYKCKICDHYHPGNRGPLFNPATYLVSAFTPFIVEDRSKETYHLIVPPLSCDNEYPELFALSSCDVPTTTSTCISVYPLSTTYSFLLPVDPSLDFDVALSYFCFYDYVDASCPVQIAGVINWDDTYTTLLESASTNEDWYGDEKTLDKIINYTLHKGLGLIKE